MCQASLSQRRAVVSRRQTAVVVDGTILLCRRRDRRAKPDPPTRSPRSTTRCYCCCCSASSPGPAHRRVQVPRRGALDSASAAGDARPPRLCSAGTGHARLRRRARARRGGTGRRRLAERARAGPARDGGTGRRTRRDRPSRRAGGQSGPLRRCGWNPSVRCVWWHGPARWSLPTAPRSARRCSSLMTDEQVAELYPTSAEPFPARTDRSITTQARLLEGDRARRRTRGLCGQLGRDRGGRGLGGRRIPRLRRATRRHRGGRTVESA